MPNFGRALHISLRRQVHAYQGNQLAESWEHLTDQEQSGHKNKESIWKRRRVTFWHTSVKSRRCITFSRVFVNLRRFFTILAVKVILFTRFLPSFRPIILISVWTLLILI